MKSKFNLNKDFKELILHSKNYLTAEFISLLVGFIALPIYTRLLSPEDFGVMSVFVSFVTLFSVVLGLGIRGAIVRYYYEEKKDFFDFFNTNLILSFIIGLFLLVIFFVFKNTIQSFFDIPIKLLYYGIIISFLTVFIQLYQAYLQASKQSKFLSFQKVLQVIIGVGFSVIIMYYLATDKYYGRSYAMLVSVLVLTGVIIYNLRGSFSFTFKKKHVIYSLSFGLPILLHLISQNVLTTFDQIMINNILGQKETGLYSIAYRIGMIQNIVSAATLAAWTPIFYNKLNLKEYDEINNLTKKYVLILCFIAIGLVLFSKEILFIFADKSYHEAVSVIPFVVIGYFFFFLYSIYVAYSFYEKNTKFISLSTIFVGGINVVLNYYLIPIFGYIGAAWSTLFSYFLLFFVHYYYSRINYKSNKPINLFFFSFPLLVIILIFYLNNYILSLDQSYLMKVLFKITILIIASFILFFIKKVMTKSIINYD